MVRSIEGSNSGDGTAGAADLFSGQACTYRLVCFYQMTLHRRFGSDKGEYACSSSRFRLLSP